MEDNMASGMVHQGPHIESPSFGGGAAASRLGARNATSRGYSPVQHSSAPHSTSQLPTATSNLSQDAQNKANISASRFDADHAVTRSLPAPDVYELNKRLHVGYLRDLPPPDIISDEWEDGIKEELDRYLCSSIRSLKWSEKKATIESVLCMACKMSPLQAFLRSPTEEKQIVLKPTVWISCVSRKCRNVIADKINGKVDGLTRFYRFLEAHGMTRPIVSLHAPRPAATLAGSSTSHDHGSRGIIFAISERDVVSGIPARLSSSSEGRKSHFTIGGMIIVDHNLYGLTTAHSFLRFLNEDATAAQDEESSSDEGSLDSDSDGDVEIGACPTGLAGAPSSALDSQESWNQISLPRILAYKCHGTYHGDLRLPIEAPQSSDFALVKVPSSTCETSSWEYQDSISGILSSDDIHEGPVKILYDPRGNNTQMEPLEGYLLRGKSSIILGSSVMRTRKIQVTLALETEGISGAWIVRDSLLCGVVFASYDRSPYLHMLPAQPLFAGITSFLGSSEVRVARQGDFGMLKDNEKDRASKSLPDVKSIEQRLDADNNLLHVSTVVLSSDSRHALMIQASGNRGWTLPSVPLTTKDIHTDHAAFRAPSEKAGITCGPPSALPIRGIRSGDHARLGSAYQFFQASYCGPDETWTQAHNTKREWMTYDEAALYLEDANELIALQIALRHHWGREWRGRAVQATERPSLIRYSLEYPSHTLEKDMDNLKSPHKQPSERVPSPLWKVVTRR